MRTRAAAPAEWVPSLQAETLIRAIYEGEARDSMLKGNARLLKAICMPSRRKPATRLQRLEDPAVETCKETHKEHAFRTIPVEMLKQRIMSATVIQMQSKIKRVQAGRCAALGQPGKSWLSCQPDSHLGCLCRREQNPSHLTHGAEQLPTRDGRRNRHTGEMAQFTSLTIT